MSLLSHNPPVDVLRKLEWDFHFDARRKIIFSNQSNTKCHAHICSVALQLQTMTLQVPSQS